MDKTPQDCTGESQPHYNDENTPTHQNQKDNFFREEFDDSDFEDSPSNDMKPGFFYTQNATIVGKQTQRGGHYKTNAANSPPELQNGLMQDEGRSACTDSRCSAEGQTNDTNSEQSSSSSSPSANIPLMRIVQSVKHTKKRNGQAIKEGWLVHYTNLDRAVKRYFWRLDSKTITLFVSEQGSKYHKEIPLAEIQAIEVNRDARIDNNFCFELKTPTANYYVGQDPLVGVKEEQAVRLPPPESGIGSDIAKVWETTIKQAYMHVTNTRKYTKFFLFYYFELFVLP